jgi:membrane protease YdiL (CAAX protease family)
MPPKKASWKNPDPENLGGMSMAKVLPSRQAAENARLEKKYDLKTLLHERDPESSFILFLIPVLLTVWVYFGKQADFTELFKGLQHRWNQDFYSTIYEYLTAFLLMFWVPYFVVKIIFKQKLCDFGFQTGNVRFGIRFVLICIPILIWSAYVGSANSAMQAEYPLAKSTMGHLDLFLTVESFYLLYYLSWEFFFRGFMLFGLEKRFGSLAAILIQTIPSAIVHIGKPASESFGAIFAGLVFGYLAIRTRSIYYPLILHAVVGISTDIFVTMRMG